MKELREIFKALAGEPGVPHALATVLHVDGSSYRRPGARMLVNVHGRIAGSVSGGCLERSVIAEAQKTIDDGRARLLHFDTTDPDDFALGANLGCQGKIMIGIEPLPAGKPCLLESMVEQIRESREPAALLTNVLGSGSAISFGHTIVSASEAEYFPALREQIKATLHSHKSCFVPETPTLVEWLGPPVALVVFGGGPDVPPLVRLAHELGHEITVIDRRVDYARPELYPEAQRVLAAKPHQIPRHLRPDARTVAVVMNHHMETDRDVLAALLPLGLPYIAMLGPRRRTERILAEIREGGIAVSEQALGTLHAPAGLDLGAETPEQIALAILAEIQATLAGHSGKSLRHRDAPIHRATLPPAKKPCLIPA